MTSDDLAKSPFAVIEPDEALDSPVIVEVPHASTTIDDVTRSTFVAPEHVLAKDADRYVDELYEGAPKLGATLIASRTSRYVVDLNRAESDVDGASVAGIRGPLRATRGVVWRLSSEGHAVLSAPLAPSELERRLASVYRPYHEALYRIIRRKIARHGLAVVLAGHSMPSVGLLASGKPGVPRADVVPGTRGRTSAGAAFIDAVEACAKAHGCSVAHDEPYRGGFTTAHYGRPRDGVHVVQIELARRLYMNETTLEKSADFPRAKSLAEAFVTVLVDVARARSRG